MQLCSIIFESNLLVAYVYFQLYILTDRLFKAIELREKVEIF